MDGPVDGHVGQIPDVHVLPIQHLVAPVVFLGPGVENALPLLVGVVVLWTGPPVRGLPAPLVAHVGGVLVGFQVLSCGEQHLDDLLPVLVVHGAIALEHQIPVDAALLRGQVDELQLVFHQIQRVPGIDGKKLLDLMVEARHRQKIPGLAVEGGEEAVVVGGESGHGDLGLVAKRFRVLIVLIELVVGVVLFGVVEHHVLFDFEDVGKALGALFDFPGDQRLYVNGAPILQLLDLCEILLGVGLFPLGPHAGVDSHKFTSSHNYSSFLDCAIRK